MWKDKKIDELLREGKAIQERWSTNSAANNEIFLKRNFSRLVTTGKVSQAIKLIENSAGKGIVQIDDQTIKSLIEKHPKAIESDPNILLNGPLKIVEPVNFERINGSMIKELIAKVHGSSGPPVSILANESRYCYLKTLYRMAMGYPTLSQK